MKRQFQSLTVTCLLSVCGFIMAASDVKVESTRPIQSLDGTKIVSVDRLSPIQNGEVEQFSGKMMIRVTNREGKNPRQRYLESSQARIIHPPVWLKGSDICAYTYNIAKNSDGIVYFIPEQNRALQIEFIMTMRRMASTGQIEQDLTSFEITEHTSQTLHIDTVPHKGGIAFPFVMPTLDTFDNQPYPLDFMEKLDAGLSAYKNFLTKKDLAPFELEDASETFSPNEEHLAFLAGSKGKNYLCVVPLKADSTVERLEKTIIKEVSDIRLSHTNDTNDTEEAVLEARYTTVWTGDETVQIQKEVFGSEDDESQKVAVYSVSLKDGELQKLTSKDPSTSGAVSSSK